MIMTSFATALATPSITDDGTLRTDTLPRLIYCIKKDYGTGLLASERRHKETKSSSLMSPVVEEENMKPVDDFPWLG